VTTSRFAEAYTRRYGLAIVPLPPRCKRPVSEDWGEHVITDPDAARAYYDEHPEANIGIALGPSRICSLDIDDA
jgi:putative DNA primase/helicase